MRKSNDPLEKVTLNLVEGDKDILAAFHPDLGWSVACREVIKRYCATLRSEEQKSLTLRPMDVEVPKL